MIEFVALRPKYSYLPDDGCVEKKARCTKNEGAIKRKPNSMTTKKCLENNKMILRWQQRFGSELHNTFMEKTNKISLSTIDYKTLKTFD